MNSPMASNRILEDNPGALAAYTNILMARLSLNQGLPAEHAVRYLDRVNESYDLPDWLHFRRAVCYQEARQFKKALRALTWVERISGTSTSLLRQQTLCWFDLREWRQALRTVDTALNLCDDPELSEIRADILVEMGRYDEALQVYDRVTDGVDRVCARAYVLERMGDFDRGIYEVDEALRAYPRDAELMARRGYLKICQGDLDGGRWDYSLSLVLEQDPALLARRAILDVDLGRLDEATRDAELSYSLDPEGEMSLKAMAVVREANQSPEEAVDFWLRYTAVSGDEQGTLILAELLNRVGRFEESDQLIEGYLERFPECWEGLYYRAAIARSRKQFELAEACLEHALHLHPDEEALLIERPILYFEWDRYTEAEDYCREFLRRFPDSREGRELQIDILAESRVPERALGLVEQLLGEEDDLVNLFRKGYVLSKLGRFDESLEILDIVVSEDPDNPDFLEIRAKTLAHLHSYSEALRDARRSVEIDPDRPWMRLLLAYLYLRCGESRSCGAEARKLLKEELPYPQRLFCRSLLIGSRIWSKVSVPTRIFDRFRSGPRRA